MADVFISYCRRDKARVQPLVAAIEDMGWSVWWDPAIVPGQEFDRQIDIELSQAAAVLVVWTPESVASRWVRGEAREAADRDILVPVRFENAQLPIDVRAFHTIDLDNDTRDPRSPQVRELLDALGTLVDRQHAATSDSPAIAATTRPHASAPERVAVCVLPFTSIGGDAAQDAFSDGITEDILTELSRWRLLAVRSRASSFRYRGMAVDVQQVARDLAAHFVVEGSVRRVGERVRITVQLIDGGSGNHVWAEKFDRDGTDLFAVQDEVVRRIVSTLVGRMQVSDIESSRRKPSASLAAYQCVLSGNALSWDDPEGGAAAKRLFEHAIELDPDYGMPHALLAAIHFGRWRDDIEGNDGALDEAVALARRAVELDSNESTCFSILALACMYQRHFDLTRQYARRAVELNPNNQWNQADMGLMLVYLGQSAEALEWFGRAREIDPFFEAPWYFRAAGQALMNLRRYDDALAMFEQVTPRAFRVAALQAGCHARLGDNARACDCAATVMALKPAFTIARFMSREPFKHPGDAVHLAESLRMAGLPE
jgi:TolB-like protein/tetratricopeptide (TPR) repeat protein